MVDAYICPLCLSVYGIGNTELMLAHVPPESIGGKPILVTCKDCNSNRGTDISLFQQACNSRILHKFVGRITNKQQKYGKYNFGKPYKGTENANL